VIFPPFPPCPLCFPKSAGYNPSLFEYPESPCSPEWSTRLQISTRFVLFSCGRHRSRTADSKTACAIVAALLLDFCLALVQLLRRPCLSGFPDLVYPSLLSRESLLFPSGLLPNVALVPAPQPGSGELTPSSIPQSFLRRPSPFKPSVLSKAAQPPPPPPLDAIPPSSVSWCFFFPLWVPDGGGCVGAQVPFAFLMKRPSYYVPLFSTRRLIFFSTSSPLFGQLTTQAFLFRFFIRLF